ncbi:hypothetical protein [Rhodovulum sp. PH10]|uniref:hypothetical protein n=1 Tax=Rhodovulum sp. PH10 TaxID=1187851 RepID=UPI0012FAF68B|nr:hypothetical protein [Rhodovulum sp. PH10]
MPNMFTIGKRLVPVDEVAFVEPYSPGENPKIQTVRNYQARVVQVNRESVLTEQSVAAFAEEHKFRLIDEDGIAVNPAVRFWVETFTPTEGFTPTKPYVTRLVWRDHDGNAQSKLLVAAPETVLAVAFTGDRIPAGSDGASEANPAPVRRGRKPRNRRRPPAATM